MENTIDTLFNKGIRPLDWIENRYGEFFIVEVHCVAGGDCATYRLVAFDKNGRFVKMEELGLLVRLCGHIKPSTTMKKGRPSIRRRGS